MQTNQAALTINCAAHVSANGLAQNSDNFHLSAAGQRALGPMLATAMTNLRQTCF
jgi:lysophospholipase L1-like esterase